MDWEKIEIVDVTSVGIKLNPEMVDLLADRVLEDSKNRKGNQYSHPRRLETRLR